MARRKTKRDAAIDALLYPAIIGLQIPIMELGSISKRAAELCAIPGEDAARVSLLRAFAMSRGATVSPC